MKTKKILLIITLVIISFVCFTDNTNVKADSNDNWVYETTIDGTMTINYTVAGRFGEYSQTAIDENGNHWRADGLRLSNTTSFDVPVKIAVKRNTAGKATYSMTVKTDSRWEMMNLCGASGASKDQWSWIIVNGNAYFDFTATGEHDLTGLEACDKTIDLTSKGCIFKVDKIYDNNPDWIIDEENWTTQKVNSITLKFTYPKIYTVSYYVRNENTDGSWGNYWLWYTEYHKYGDTYSTTGYKDDVEYQEVSASGTVDDDKTIYLDAYKKWYTIKYYVKNENVDGSWGDYWFWFETSYRYGSTYHTDGYGNDESGADNDIYSNFCIRGTVTGNKDWYIDAYRRRYALDLNMVYGDKKLCTNEEISPFFSFDVYINGKLTDENIADYWTELPYGTTYEFRNFRMKPGYVFGDNGSLSGTIGAKNNEAVAYVYDDYALAYYGGNGATGGQGNANGGNDYYVSYNIRYNYLNENGNASAMNNLFTKNNYAFVNYKTENGNYRKAGENIDTSDNNNARAVIRSAYNNNLVFNVAGDNNVDGTNIQLWWDDISNYSNYWSFLPSGDGYYYIVNNTNGKFLDLAYGNTSDLANVQLHHLNWSEAQQWKLIPAGDGYYYIASRCNENYRLDTEGGSQSSNAGQNVCVYHGQKWKIDFLNREDYFQVQWTPATRLIEYYGNGDNDNFSYFKSLQATDDNIADTNRFKRVGYTFTGYNTSADSLGKSYKENDVIDKTDCQGITLIRNHTDYNIAVKQNNSTLYAQQADYEMTQWWSFIKADNAQAYYIMNMSTGQALYSSSGEVKTAALDKSNSAFMWDLELVDVHEYKISVHNKNEYLTMRSDNSIYVDSKYSDTESSYDYQVWNIDGISSALYAQWKPNPDTPYVVKHWKEKLYIDGTTQYANASEHNETNYFLADTDNLKGTTDSLVTPGVKNYEGFTAPEAQTVIIKPDGSLVVNYYYTRNTYKLGGDDSSGNSTSISTKNGIESASGAGAYKYEEPVTVSAEVKTGYHWHTSGCNCETDLSKYPTGWYSVNSSNITTFISGSSYDTQTMKFTMPAHNVYLAVRATNNSYYINFNSNGGNGSMDKIKAVYDEDIKLPKNTFTRSTPEGESKFLNWYDNNNTYADEETVKNLTSKLNDTVTLFVKWDDCPVITAIDRYFTLDNAQTGKITYDSLMSTATVTDDNDNPEDIIFEIIDYSERDFTTLTNNAVISVTYRATDSAVNSTVKMILVHIVSTEAEKVENTKYVRSISENYYDKPYEDGGLEPDSIWRTNSEYAETLKKAMDNRASITYDVEQFRVVFADFPYYNYGNMSCDHIEQEWTFTHDDIKKVQTYVDTYGLGNIYDANNLQRFIEEFSYCKNY